MLMKPYEFVNDVTVKPASNISLNAMRKPRGLDSRVEWPME